QRGATFLRDFRLGLRSHSRVEADRDPLTIAIDPSCGSRTLGALRLAIDGLLVRFFAFGVDGLHPMSGVGRIARRRSWATRFADAELDGDVAEHVAEEVPEPSARLLAASFLGWRFSAVLGHRFSRWAY